MYRTRIQTFVQRENELKENNRKLRETISDIERSSHDTVAVNLRRFDQYQVKTTIVLMYRKSLFIFFRKRHQWSKLNKMKKNKNYSMLLIENGKPLPMKLKVKKCQNYSRSLFFSLLFISV